MSSTTASASIPRPRREAVPAGLLQWGTWALVVVLVIGPFVPLVESSLRDRPLYESGGVWTFEPYRQLLGDHLFWTAWKNTLGFAAHFLDHRLAIAEQEPGLVELLGQALPKPVDQHEGFAPVDDARGRHRHRSRTLDHLREIAEQILHVHQSRLPGRE